jgi:hypothetical protein
MRAKEAITANFPLSFKGFVPHSLSDGLFVEWEKSSCTSKPSLISLFNGPPLELAERAGRSEVMSVRRD